MNPLVALTPFFYEPMAWWKKLLAFALVGLFYLAFQKWLLKPVLWIVLRIAIWRRRGRENRCPVCGYDVRATPERCPECGSELPDDSVDGWQPKRATGNRPDDANDALKPGD
jgi:hypothetical protein